MSAWAIILSIRQYKHLGLIATSSLYNSLHQQTVLDGTVMLFCSTHWWNILWQLKYKDMCCINIWYIHRNIFHISLGWIDFYSVFVYLNDLPYQVISYSSFWKLIDAATNQCSFCESSSCLANTNLNKANSTNQFELSAKRKC